MHNYIGLLSEHSCCFYVNTEIGQLDNFSKRLGKIKEPVLGKKVILNEKNI